MTKTVNFRRILRKMKLFKSTNKIEKPIPLPPREPTVGDILRERSRTKRQKKADEDFKILMDWFKKEFEIFLHTWQLINKDHYCMTIERKEMFSSDAMEQANKEIKRIIAPHGLTTYGLSYSPGIETGTGIYRNNFSLSLNWD